MLAEALEYLISPCPRWARRLGYLHQAVSLRARARRWRKAWAPHRAACHRFIVEAMAACPERRRVVVLGSGLLLEVPLAELAAGFEAVVLVDLVHLWPERWQARRWPHVRLVEADLTGILESLVAAKRLPALEALAGGLPPVLTGERFDLVVSVNLLSQLALPPLWYCERQRLEVSEEQAAALTAALIRQHLALLDKLAPASCLITDLETVILDGPREVERCSLLPGVTLPAASAEWTWAIAPRPELYRQFDVCHRVGGFLSLPGSRGADPQK